MYFESLKYLQIVYFDLMSYFICIFLFLTKQSTVKTWTQKMYFWLHIPEGESVCVQKKFGVYKSIAYKRSN